MKFLHVLFLAITIMAAPVVAAHGQGSDNFILPERGMKSALKWNPLNSADLVRRGPGIGAVSEVARNLDTVESITTRGAAEVRVYANAAPSVVMIVSDDGMGSGVVISRDGRIVTNWHVVGDDKFVGIIFKPEKAGKKIEASDILTAEVLRIDQVSDLALLQVTDKLPRKVMAIGFGNIDKLNVGDDVHAIGHPGGGNWTYTKGFVSQIRPDYKWKTESGVTHEAVVVQTQTPINPGNSGGPLLNDKGKLIGINSFKSQGEGLNFAVAVDSVQQFLARTTSRMATATPKSKSECEGEKTFEGRTDEDDGEMLVMDSDCDGVEDTMIVVPDKRSEPIELIFFDGRTGQLDGVIFDEDRDQKWDFSLWDTTGDGTLDSEGIHRDGGMTPIRYQKLKK